MTLIELLAVIVIITTIVAAAIPLISPTNDDRRLREAARGLNTYIVGAQSRAIAARRQVGVAFKRIGTDTIKTTPKIGQDNGIAVEAYYVEQQPPYSGFDANSRACVAIQGPTVLIRFVTRGSQTGDGLPVGWDADLFPLGLVRPGDVVEIGGTQFALAPTGGNMSIDSTTKSFVPPGNGVPTLMGAPLNDTGQQINPTHDNQGLRIGEAGGTQPPFWTSPAPYQILRQPTPMSDEPYQLPEGTAVDLRASGVGDSDYFYVQGVNDNPEGIVIMFAPEGRVARVGFYQGSNTSANPLVPFDQAVVDNIYLLVGRRDRIPPDATPTSDSTLNAALVSAATTDEARARLREPINWLSGSSRWVVIGSQTGRIATIENTFVDLLSIVGNPPPDETMRNRQILAARELTREMGQLGGR